MPADSKMLVWAKAYAKLNWNIFPVTGFKTPFKGSHGHLDASTEANQIESWWTEKPNSNIAVRLGDIVVIDADGARAIARLKDIAARHGGMPRTAVAQTARGIHVYFKAPVGVTVRTRNEPRAKSGDDGIDIKAHGGWTVLPPSVNAKTGFVYKWISPLPLAELPMWILKELDQPIETTKIIENTLGPMPEHLKGKNTKNVNALAEQALATVWSAAEQSRLISALSAIPATSYDVWLNVGMACKDLDWQRNDGTDIGFELWVAWSETSPEKFSLAACEDKWRSFKRSGISIGTVYHLASQHGWNGGVPDPTGHLNNSGTGHLNNSGTVNGTYINGHANGSTTLPAAFANASQAIFFPDVTETGKVRPTMTNAKVAIHALGVNCKYDLFHNRMLVAGELINRWNSTELSDHIVSMLRDVIRYRYGFDPNKQNTQDACETLCLQHRFDPVLDYLDGLKWDGVPRLERWLASYLGAADTELNAAIGKLALVAAVRRARHPGTKFDQIVVLEGRQGIGKSEAIEILAGPENFSDQSILGVDDRKQQELTEGVWLYEIGELSGMKRAEIEHVKAFASRKTDRARPAYGRYTVSQPRRTVFFASTNLDSYLQDDTGNRRFWPVAVHKIDLAGLRRDRDQLWAEASHLEAQGISHVLPERLWSEAGREQEKRMQTEHWLELIHNYLNLVDKPKHDVSVVDVLCDNQFIQMRPNDVKQSDAIKAGRVLHQLGFVRYQKRLDDGVRVWRYRRKEEDRA